MQQRKQQETAAQKVGRPKIGGPFELVDQDGKPFTEQGLLGKWSLVYVSATWRAVILHIIGLTGSLTFGTGCPVWIHKLPGHLPRGTGQDELGRVRHMRVNAVIPQQRGGTLTKRSLLRHTRSQIARDRHSARFHHV